MMNKKLLKEKYGNEKVYVISYEKAAYISDGFTTEKHDPDIWRAFDNIGEYIYRYEAEGNPIFQQIIPYILIYNKDKNKLFTTKRINGDSRLINKISIACGGHINVCDGATEILFKAAVRELFEEVNFQPFCAFEIIGYVRDMTSSTNDHIGVVITIKANEDIEVIEKDNLIGEWMSLVELINNYNNLEGWSKYIVDYFVSQKEFI